MDAEATKDDRIRNVEQTSADWALAVHRHCHAREVHRRRRTDASRGDLGARALERRDARRVLVVATYHLAKHDHALALWMARCAREGAIRARRIGIRSAVFRDANGHVAAAHAALELCEVA